MEELRWDEVRSELYWLAFPFLVVLVPLFFLFMHCYGLDWVSEFIQRRMAELKS